MKTSTSKKATATNVKETKTMGRYSAYSCINTITKMIRMVRQWKTLPRSTVLPNPLCGAISVSISKEGIPAFAITGF